MIFLIISLTIVTIPYDLKSGFQKVEFHYSPDGKAWYPIGVNQYLYSFVEDKDTFRWAIKGSPKDNTKIKVVYSSHEKRIEKELKDFQVEIKEDKGSDYSNNVGLSKVQESDTSYSWRMFGYDPQHTGHYPYPLYPPLELKWEYGKSMDGSADYTMVSSCAGNSMLYTRKGSEGSYGINWVAAIDIETGEEVWSRELTSNVWTTVLSYGDSLLFVGTSSGWDTLSPTFYCMDPFTGEVKWSKFSHTVEYSPIVVDTIVYAPDLQGNLYAYTFSGNTLWSIRIIGPPPGILVSPAYLNNKVYTCGDKRALLSLDAYTGETLWVYETSSWIEDAPVIFDSHIVFSSNGDVFVLNANNGNLIWKRTEPYTSMFTFSVKGRDLLFNRSYWVVQDSIGNNILHRLEGYSGDFMWADTFYTRYTGAWRYLITKNDLIWTCDDWVFGFRMSNGSMIFKSDSLVPGNINPVIYTSVFSPILYRNYLIGSHRTKLFLYQGRTEPLDTLNVNSIIAIPNPFSSSVQIIGKTDVNILSVYDLMGRKIMDIEGKTGEFGYMYFRWDGRDKAGISLPSGVYLCVVGSLKQKLIKIRN